ncbi:MAG: hypothetical protein H6605_06460 [Flavobacteriales bacterium]|nr:hypothetical protein [Flavobacteriales bacterium]
MPRYPLFTLIIFIAFTSFGQIGEKSFFGGVLYKSSGLGLAFQSKTEINEKMGKQIDLELSTFRHPQEVKTFNTEISNPTPYVYGKLNKAALLKLYYSRSYKLTQFNDAQRVGVDVTFGGGLILAFLKPVYINLIYPDNLGSETIVSEKYDPDKHKDKNQIAGYSNGRLGWNELATRPGLHLSAGAGFTWGYFTNYPKRLETGFYVEAFNSGLPLMAFAKNKPLNEGVYVKLFIGKRNYKN